MSTELRTWPPHLPLEIALGIEDEQALALRHELSIEELNALLCTPAFAMQVAHYRKELHENGEIFRAKARAQAEVLLDTSFLLAQSASTPPNVRAELIKNTVEWADLKPKKGDTQQGSGFSITFNFPLPTGAPAPAGAAPARAAITIDNP